MKKEINYKLRIYILAGICVFLVLAAWLQAYYNYGREVRGIWSGTDSKGQKVTLELKLGQQAILRGFSKTDFVSHAKWSFDFRHLTITLRWRDNFTTWNPCLDQKYVDNELLNYLVAVDSVRKSMTFRIQFSLKDDGRYQYWIKFYNADLYQEPRFDRRREKPKLPFSKVNKK